MALTSKSISKYLEELGSRVHSVDDEGNPITREQAIAELVWKMALGYTEKVRDAATGQFKEVYRPPVAWAMELVWDRREGKVAQSAPEEPSKIKASEKVRSLARDRLNALLPKTEPPAYKR